MQWYLVVRSFTDLMTNRSRSWQVRYAKIWTWEIVRMTEIETRGIATCRVVPTFGWLCGWIRSDSNTHLRIDLQCFTSPSIGALNIVSQTEKTNMVGERKTPNSTNSGEEQHQVPDLQEPWTFPESPVKMVCNQAGHSSFGETKERSSLLASHYRLHIGCTDAKINMIHLFLRVKAKIESPGVIRISDWIFRLVSVGVPSEYKLHEWFFHRW